MCPVGNACHRSSIIKEQVFRRLLHEQHPGIVAMEAITRRYMWLPNLNAEIALVVKSCEVYRSVRTVPPVSPLHPWKWPT